MKRILIIEVNWLGDVLFSTPFIKAVKGHYKDSYLAVLVVPGCVEVLTLNPHVDKVIAFDEDGAHKGIIGKIRLIAELRKERFDIAFILHRSFTRALIALLSGIGSRVGYFTRKRALILSKPIEVPVKEMHKVEYFLNIASSMGMDTGDKSYEFHFGGDDKFYIESFLFDKGVTADDKIVVINPGGNWNPKRWPEESFAQLIDALTDAFGAKVVITGAAKDIPLAEEISNMTHKKPLISCGKTTIKRLGALLSKAKLVISNDSGPMHLAVAVGAKVIALFGPTSPELTGPYGDGDYVVIRKAKDCDVPCYDLSCTDNKCMRLITVDDVMKEARGMLGKTGL